MAGPLYRQIAETLRSKIDSGELGPGSQLPTEDELMEIYHASRNTVRGALNQLTIRGLVNTLHGRGTFVAEQVNPIVTTLTTDPETGSGGGEGLVYTAEVAASGREATTNGLTVEVQQAEPGGGRLAPHPARKRRHQPSRAAFRGWAGLVTPDVVLPAVTAERAPRLQDPEASTKAPSRTCAHAVSSRPATGTPLEVRSPNREETEFFDLPADGRIQVIEIFRVAFDQNQQTRTADDHGVPRGQEPFTFNVGDVPIS